ncbi:ABC transporter permease [Streptomyces sp. UNOC14_S4]|uniref:ABC transporter permease n=1 Tax=Streptomyces sp. UNOC14_S4 TaxID=2872340 RepID=UPI001E378695|nr:ABC transporter permease [Streptomyces sp. UNOC14_S4]MCC3767058.1 ABC transporter permease [Streptomyces sp. UNOC14_S4]
MSAPSASPLAEARKVLIIVAVVQFVIAGWFSWTSSHVKPRDLPVLVVAAGQQGSGFADALREAAPGAYKIKTADDAEAADKKLKDREAYGAFVPTAKGLELHIASAASPAVAQALVQQAQELQGGKPVAVTDVVPADSDDPHGSGIGMGFLPLLITAVIAGLLFVLKVRSVRAKLVGLVGFAVLSGLLSSLMLTQFTSVLPGDYFVTAGVIALLELAMVGAITGLGSLIGPPGIALAAVLTFVVGNPLSGMASAPEMLPQPLGAIGQFLPAGAAASLFRSSGSFHGAGAGGPVLVLVVWSLIGLGLLFLSAKRAGAKAAGAAAPTGTSAGAASAEPVTASAS